MPTLRTLAACREFIETAVLENRAAGRAASAEHYARMAGWVRGLERDNRYQRAAHLPNLQYAVGPLAVVDVPDHKRPY